VSGRHLRTTVGPLLSGLIVTTLAITACTRDKSKPIGSREPDAAAAGRPEADAPALELRLSLNDPPNVRSGEPIPLELHLVNRSPSVTYWLGGSATPPVVRVTAQLHENDAWIDVPPTPMDAHCGPFPFSWTTPVNPIEPLGTWTFEDEFSVTTSRCSRSQLKFIGFEFPHTGRARIVARYTHPGQTGEPAFGAPRLTAFELVSAPLEVQVTSVRDAGP